MTQGGSVCSLRQKRPRTTIRSPIEWPSDDPWRPRYGRVTEAEARNACWRSARRGAKRQASQKPSGGTAAVTATAVHPVVPKRV